MLPGHHTLRESGQVSHLRSRPLFAHLPGAVRYQRKMDRWMDRRIQAEWGRMGL